MLTTTAPSFHVNDSVVRKTSRRKIVGTVTSVHGAKVYVKWHKSQGGFTRIAGGNQSSLIKADCLILAKDFIPRPLSSPPLDAPRTSAWHVSLEWHPSGRRVGEYGVNLWWEASEEAGRARFVEVCLAHPGREVRLSRKDTITWIPQGCRCERQRTEWVRLETKVEERK